MNFITYTIELVSYTPTRLIRALAPYYSHLLLLLNHVVIVVNLCCVVGPMEDRCISNKHSCYQKSLLLLYLVTICVFIVKCMYDDGLLCSNLK